MAGFWGFVAGGTAIGILWLLNAAIASSCEWSAFRARADRQMESIDNVARSVDRLNRDWMWLEKRISEIERHIFESARGKGAS